MTMGLSFLSDRHFPFFFHFFYLPFFLFFFWFSISLHVTLVRLFVTASCIISRMYSAARLVLGLVYY